MIRTNRFALLFAGALLARPADAGAQASATTAATATVVQALTVTGTGDLLFGTIAFNATKTIAPAAGGTFQIRGEPGMPVSVGFTLPATLAHPTLPLSAWTGLVNTTPSVSSAVPFVPSAFPQTLSGGSGRLYLWLGATLTAVSTPSGSYTTPVTITVVYN